jgi:hypothetical protein
MHACLVDVKVMGPEDKGTREEIEASECAIHGEPVRESTTGVLHHSQAIEQNLVVVLWTKRIQK